MASVRAGDDTAFEELYRRYSRRISLFVNGFVRDEGRAEDVTQEAFMSALRRMRETDSPIAFRPWIYEIARNGAIDLHRRTSRAEEIPIDESIQLPSSDRRRLVGSRAPENELAAKESFEHLRGALDELSETHHRILVLRELEGLSYREIGVRMDLTAPAVESTLFRARRRLEQEYSEIDTGRRCAAMRSIIARLAEGMELPRERRKLERHALRCGRCRKGARELGVEPMMRRGRIVSRAAALLPLPALLRRRVDAGWTVAAGSAAETGGSLAGKVGALLAAAALAGGGGATLGGVGPLVPDIDERQAVPGGDGPAKSPAGGVPRGDRPAEGARPGGREQHSAGEAAPGGTPAREAPPTNRSSSSAPPPPGHTGPVTGGEDLPPLPPLDQPPPPSEVPMPGAELPPAPEAPQAPRTPEGPTAANAAPPADTPQVPEAPADPAGAVEANAVSSLQALLPQV